MMAQWINCWGQEIANVGGRAFALQLVVQVQLSVRSGVLIQEPLSFPGSYETLTRGIRGSHPRTTVLPRELRNINQGAICAKFNNLLTTINQL